MPEETKVAESSERAQSTREEDDISLLDLAIVLVENLKLLIVAPLAAGLAAFGISFLIPPTYTATTRLLPPQHQQSATAAVFTNQLGGLLGAAGAAGSIRNPADTYVAMIKSRTVANVLL